MTELGHLKTLLKLKAERENSNFLYCTLLQIEKLEKEIDLSERADRLHWLKTDVKPDVCKPILFVAFGEYISGKYMGDDQWDSVGIAFYSTDQVEKWAYIPE